MKKKTENINPAVLPYGKEFTFSCEIEQTDQFQADFLEAYGDMLYERDRIKKQTIIATAIFSVLSVGILLSNTIVNEYLWFSLGFGLMFLLYGVYFLIFGYRNEYQNLQKFLSRAIDENRTIYPTQKLMYEFKEDSIYFTDSEGTVRFFLYSDIRYVEETDRFIIFGLKYLPREKRLYELPRVLFTKRYLSEEEEYRFRMLIQNVIDTYEIKPVLEDHPFK